MADTIRNVDLCALLDGECDAVFRARLEADLLRAPACAQRLSLWRRNDAALRLATLARAGGLTPEARLPAFRHPPPPPPPLRETHRPRRDRSTGLLLIGFSGGALFGGLALAALVFS